MAPDNYIVAIGEPEGSGLRSYEISKRRLVGYGLIAGGVILLISLLFAALFAKLEIGLESRDISLENERLRARFVEWEGKMMEMQNIVDDLKKRNSNIRTTASLSTPELEYGVGGSESALRTGLMEIPEMTALTYSLSKLKAELEWIRESTTELENSLSSKLSEIAHYPTIRPVQGGWISSGFGRRTDPFTGVEEAHEAVDIAIRPGSDVRATGAGIVKKVNKQAIKNMGYGKYIIIDHGYGYETLYGHLSEIYVRQGQQIKRWEMIGLTGNTGKSTAPHIHYSVSYNGRPKNPFHFFLE